MVYFLSRLRRWVQGTAPGRMLTCAPLTHVCALCRVVVHAQSCSLQWTRWRVAVAPRNHRALAFFLIFRRSMAVVSGDTSLCSHILPPVQATAVLKVGCHVSMPKPPPSAGAPVSKKYADSLPHAKVLPQPVLKTAMLSIIPSCVFNF